MQLYLLSEKKCILISTATALLFTVAWFLSFDSPDEWYYCWETVKKQDLFSDTIKTSVTLLSNKPEPSFICIN